MKMIPLPGSKNIARAGYDPATQTLRIEFRNGGAYDYADVPSETHTGLVAADSPGSYFHKEIRGKYGHRKLEPQTDAAAA